MPYNPGITYDGDRYLAQGITSAADSIAGTIKKYGEENELVKSYRSVAKNTPGFYDFMGVSKEEMGGMGNKDVIALFKGYATRTAIEDERQKRQFAVNAEARAVDAAQLAARQETRQNAASAAQSDYYRVKGSESTANAAVDNAKVSSLAYAAEQKKAASGELYDLLSAYGDSSSPEHLAKEKLKILYKYNQSSEDIKEAHSNLESILDSQAVPLTTETNDGYIISIRGKFSKFVPKAVDDEGEWERLYDESGQPTNMVINKKTKKTRTNVPLKKGGALLDIMNDGKGKTPATPEKNKTSYRANPDKSNYKPSNFINVHEDGSMTLEKNDGRGD